jgi:hypothetical protein
VSGCRTLVAWLVFQRAAHSRRGPGLQAAWMMQRSQLEGRIQQLEEGA